MLIWLSRYMRGFLSLRLYVQIIFIENTGHEKTVNGEVGGYFITIVTVNEDLLKE